MTDDQIVHYINTHVRFERPNYTVKAARRWALDSPGVLIKVEFPVIDWRNDRPDTFTSQGFIPRGTITTEDEIPPRVLNVVVSADFHEDAEHLLVDGQRIFNPHANPEGTPQDRAIARAEGVVAA